MKPISRALIFCSALALGGGLPGSASAEPEIDKCDELYFGAAGKPDFPRALKCYQARQAWPMLILMRLNGEGAPADLAQAEALYKEWEKASPPDAKSLQGEALSKLIEERKRDRKTVYPRIDYCQDIAGDTLATNFCAEIGQRIEEARFNGKMKAIKTSLPPAGAAQFGKVMAEHAKFRKAEGERMFQRNLEGTIRVAASLSQTQFTRRRFMDIAADTLEKKQLKPADESAYKAADADLNLVYAADIKEYADEYEERLKAPGNQNQKAALNRQIEDYKKLAKQTQIHWIKYRDLFADLARLLYKEKPGSFNPALSLKTALTKIRIEELQNNPLGER